MRCFRAGKGLRVNAAGRFRLGDYVVPPVDIMDSTGDTLSRVSHEKSRKSTHIFDGYELMFRGKLHGALHKGIKVVNTRCCPR